MSKELATPKVSYCSSDNYHLTTPTLFDYANFAGQTTLTGPSTMAKAGGGQCSYFVNGDAVESDPQMILGGDENMGFNATAQNNPAAGFFNANLAVSTAPIAAYALSLSPGGGGGVAPVK